MTKGYLVLDTGEVFSGVWMGGEPRSGEVVFNTSHCGYEEIASDPSYYHQIMVMTYPLQGNYGASNECWESAQFHIDGFICMEMQATERDSQWLKKLVDFNIPVLTNVDTRALVLTLREKGTPWGALVVANNEQAARQEAERLIETKRRMDTDWAYAVSRKKKEIFQGKGNFGRVAVIDYGCKQNIIRELQERVKEVAVFPSRASAKEIQDWNPDGILLSNGPGNPEDVQVTTQTVRELLGTKPIFGICMGHQILALALGGKTYKLKFGHRGSNHPVKDHITKHVYITSQNHGYSVVEQSLPNDVQATHINLNDQTLAGIECSRKRCFSVQFHPESHPGPHEAVTLFDYFVGQLK